MNVVLRMVVITSSLMLAGCECSDGSDGDGDAAADGSAADRDGSSADDDSGGGGDDTEVCDEIDNDGNGIIDDVDEGNDGVCDCLAIATLGTPGEWGEGDVFSTWLSDRSSYPVVHLGDEELTAERLEPMQVIVAQDMRGRDYSDAEVAALEAWIRAGGGFFTLIGFGDPTERTNINRLLGPTGASYGDQPILAGSPTIAINAWQTHPVSDQVTRVGVDNGYPVDGAGTVIAEEGGFVLLRAIELGQGKVLVWGDEWITYDSEWTDHPDYQVERFWLNAIKWLTPANECQVPILI